MSINSVKDFANRDVSNLLICDYMTGAPYINIDYANITTTDITGEVVHAYGGQGHPKKITFSGDRGGTMTVETQVQEKKLYKLITGSANDTLDTHDVNLAEKTYISTESSNKIFWLDKQPKSNDDIKVCKDGSVVDASYSVAGSATNNRWKVTVSTNGASFNNGDQIVVFYVTTTTSEKIAVKADTFPRAVIIYADTWDKSTDDSIVGQKMIVYKAVPQPNFSLSNSNSGDPGTLTMTFDLMEDRDHNILDLIFKNRA